MLAATKDYQNSIKAEKLLRSNSQDSSLLLEDKLSMAELLASRPEPISKIKAIGLLEEIDHVQTLNEAAAIQLAELYFATRTEWTKYQNKMEIAITRYPNSVRAYESYIRRLLIRGDANAIDRATALVGKLREIAPNYPATFELTVRLADKLGKQKQVADELRRRLPNLDGTQELDPATKQTAAMFASLLSDLKDYESAEKIYRSLAARDPRLSYELAKFIGLHRSPDECFAKLTELYTPEKIPETLDVATNVVRERRDKVGDKYDAQIQRWLDAGLRENPDSVSLLAIQADLYDVQKRYEDSAKLYRKVLDQKNLVGPRRAVVINNLAFLLALADKSTASDVDPLKLVSEAADILGPSSDILDTRAVVYISREQFREAVADLELAVTDNPTASKYFHLAQAHLGANESRAAVEAWEKAEGLSLTRESLNRMEYDRYEKVKAEIAKIRGPSVTKSDSIRKAG
jgi:tetratricopeptide (TPR) repeat protein